MKKIVLLSLSVFAAFSLFAQQPRDWAQYGRYERQNAALAGEPCLLYTSDAADDS